MPQQHTEQDEHQKPRVYAMTWADGGPAQRRDGAPLKRVFAIEIEKCEKCGGPVRVIASMFDYPANLF